MTRKGDIYWIGGSVCAGKSTVARNLASQATLYHYDARERAHLLRLGRGDMVLEDISDPETRRRAMDERWVARSPSAMAQGAQATWASRFPLVLEDLTASSAERIIAEGIGLFPRLVEPLLQHRRQAIWLVATPEFIRWARAHRGVSVKDETSDPETAFENIVQRDIIISGAILNEAQDARLPVIRIDGVLPPETIASRVADHFGVTL